MTKPQDNIIIELPWLNPALHTNARRHWSVKAAATKKARNTAKYLTIDALNKAGGADFAHTESIPIKVIFHPKNNRMDASNIKSCGTVKAYLDGVADALGVNDKRFVDTKVIAENVAGGKVIIEIGGSV